MAETLLAATDIKHGKADGSIVRYDAGDKVKKSDFDDASWEELQANGALATASELAATEPDAHRIRVLEQEIDALRLALETKGADPDKAVAEVEKQAQQGSESTAVS